MDLSNTLYKKDAEGNSIVTEVSYCQGNVYTHFPEMRNMCKVLTEVDKSTPRDDDIWIMAYPKSGSHWLYEIIGILQSGQLEPMKEMKDVQLIDIKSSFSQIEERPSPRVITTHSRVQLVPKVILEKCKTIFMVRNPKSVAVSYYHHILSMKHFHYEGSFEGFYELYMQGVEDLFGNWFEYVTDWWDSIRGNDNVLILYYEDLKKNPLDGIKKIASFIGVSRDDAFCKEVVNLTSFETMSTNAKKDLDTSDPIKPIFFRQGKIDDWKNYFTLAKNRDFDKVYAEKMKMYSDLTANIKYE